MSTKTNHQANAENEDNLLNAQERSLLSQIAAGAPPFSQRAHALLAIDEGSTQVAAGHQAGLSKGQVRYWLNKFRKDRIAIFPQELLDQTRQEDASSLQILAEPESPPDKPDLEQAASAAEVQQEIPVIAEMDAPIDPPSAAQADPPEAGKKPKKKDKKVKKQKKKKKGKKDKQSQKKKKAKKGKKTKKGKGSKGKSGKKKKKRKK